MNAQPQPWPLDQWFDTEAQFSQLYPLHIRQLNETHWTPLRVAYRSLSFLKTKPGVKILDIGSGIGKFCLAGAYFKPKALLYGIEQRKSLLEHATHAQQVLGLGNVKFLEGNFTQIDFKEFDHFYFFNSFGENLTEVARIDESIDYSAELYHYYSNLLRAKLDAMPAGTRFVSYCSNDDEVPISYHLEKTQYDGSLKFWIKKEQP